MLTVYGIKQCDTCRKALKWLEAQGIEHQFHDLRVDGLSGDRLGQWLASPLAAQLVNRRSTTWRQIDDQQRKATGTALLRVLLQHPTLIKRPLFEQGDELVAIGFDPAHLQALL